MRTACRLSRLRIVFAAGLVAASFDLFTVQAKVAATTEANVPVEVAFTASETYRDPFNDVDLDVVFTDPAGKQLHVPAFWAGGNLWKARYASPLVGAHQFRTECSKGKDKGLQSVTGAVAIKPYAGENPLYKHGPLRVANGKRTLEHADGKPFLWLGDTWWMGLSKRLKWPEEFQTLAQDRKAKGFNVVQIVMGPPPDSHPFDPRSVNEAGFPWTEGYASIRPEYYDAADERIAYLVDQGFTPCMVGMWGYHLQFMGVERATQHWQYLIARYGALPVVWCAAGEANLPWYLAPGFPYDDRKQVTKWTEVMRYIQKTDPFDRLLTVHPTGFGWSGRYCTDDIALLDFDLLQTPHGQRDAVDLTVGKVRESYAAKPTMPVIDGEAAYEMLGDSLPTQWTRQMFWLCMSNGAAGHTYGANGIWQCNRPGDPHGPSPQHAAGSDGYGKIPWDEAMNLPGSTQVALGKKLFEKYQWHKFQPHPEWAEYATEDGQLKPQWGKWIWFPEGEPATDAPAAKRFFFKSFEAADGEPIDRGTLWISADDKFVATLNGQRVGSHATWQSPQPIDVTAHLRPGKNTLAIEAENVAATGANPAGLLVSLRVKARDGKVSDVRSDASWRCADKVPATGNWAASEPDDASWVAAKELGDYGEPPWGQFQDAATYGPYATGIPGQVRLIYVPVQKAVRATGLEADVKYRAEAFDPVSGKITDLGPVAADDDGGWTAPVPPLSSADGDWVLILEPSK